MKAISSLPFIFMIASSLCFSMPVFADEELDCEITVEPTMCHGTTRVTTPDELADYLAGPKTSNLVVGDMNGGLLFLGEDLEIATACKVTLPANTTLVVASLAIQAGEVALMGKVIGVDDEVSVVIDTHKFVLGNGGRLKNLCLLSVHTIDADIMGVARGTMFGNTDCPNEQIAVELCAEHKASFGTGARMTAFDEMELIAGQSLTVNGAIFGADELFLGPEDLPKLEIKNAYMSVDDIEAEAFNISVSHTIIDGGELIFFEAEGGSASIQSSQFDAEEVTLGAETGQLTVKSTEINAVAIEVEASEVDSVIIAQSSLMAQESLNLETEGGDLNIANSEMFAADAIEVELAEADDALQISGIDILGNDASFFTPGNVDIKKSRLLLFSELGMEIAADLDVNGLLFTIFGDAEYDIGGDYTATGVNSFTTGGTCTFNVGGTSTGQEPCP